MRMRCPNCGGVEIYLECATCGMAVPQNAETKKPSEINMVRVHEPLIAGPTDNSYFNLLWKFLR